MKITTTGTQKESQILDIIPTRKSQVLHYDLEYDFTKPEETIRDFVSNIRAMISRFEENKNRVIEIENELQDIYHYIEISTYKKVPDGYKLYRKMAELRRERRACKNENDLLLPIYEHFHATEVLNKLTMVQGECAKCKEAIDNRTYSVRTDIINEWIEPAEPVTVDVVTDDVDIVIDPSFERVILEDSSVQDVITLPAFDCDNQDKRVETKDKPMSAFKQVWKGY